MSRSKIVEELIASLRDEVSGESLEDVRIGLFYTGVKLSSGASGVAFTPRDVSAKAICCPEMAGKAPFSGSLRDYSVAEAAELAQSGNPLLRAVGIAVINALSSKLIFVGGGAEVSYEEDALDAVEVREADKVVMIGAFKPYIKKLGNHVAELYVYEKNPLLREEAGLMEEPSRNMDEALREADLVIITGSAFVVSNIDEILREISNARDVVLVGPTASMNPEPLFRHGVTVVGGVRITDPDVMLRVVSEAGGTRALLKSCARKYVVKAGRAKVRGVVG